MEAVDELVSVAEGRGPVQFVWNFLDHFVPACGLVWSVRDFLVLENVSIYGCLLLLDSGKYHWWVPSAVFASYLCGKRVLEVLGPFDV